MTRLDEIKASEYIFLGEGSMPGSMAFRKKVYTVKGLERPIRIYTIIPKDPEGWVGWITIDGTPMTGALPEWTVFALWLCARRAEFIPGK